MHHLYVSHKGNHIAAVKPVMISKYTSVCPPTYEAVFALLSYLRHWKLGNLGQVRCIFAHFWDGVEARGG